MAAEEKEIELLPCPFCGGKVKIEERGHLSGYPSTCSMGGFSFVHTEITYSILCGRDGCWLSMARHYTNKEKMIQEWNRRPGGNFAMHQAL